MCNEETELHSIILSVHWKRYLFSSMLSGKFAELL